MKKLIAFIVLACAFTAASANNSTTINAKTITFVQPFNQSYALEGTYIWFTDIDLTNPVGTFCDIFYEINRLRGTFTGFSFSHVPYAGLNEFEFGVGFPWVFATIYSDLNR